MIAKLYHATPDIISAMQNKPSLYDMDFEAAENGPSHDIGTGTCLSIQQTLQPVRFGQNLNRFRMLPSGMGFASGRGVYRYTP